MSICPKCGASVSMYDTGGNPWYACGSTKTFRSGSCVDREPVWTQLLEAQQRIKRLEELGHELRECASQLGWTSSDDSRWIERAEAAVEAWDKEAKP